MTKFEHADNGELVEIESGNFISFACCDCALVHELHVCTEDDKVIVSFTRNQRKTGALRRYHGIPAWKEFWFRYIARKVDLPKPA